MTAIDSDLLNQVAIKKHFIPFLFFTLFVILMETFGLIFGSFVSAFERIDKTV